MDKIGLIDDLLQQFRVARSVCFGGGGLSRKPMLAAAAIATSDVKPKDIYSLLGGPEVDILVAFEKLASLHFAYVGLDSIGLAPNFRAAREQGRLEVVESSEYLVLAGLEASSRHVPFLPTRSGLGTDVLSTPNSPYRTFECPLTGEILVAVPAIRPDLAVVHVNVADSKGNAIIYGDSFADELLVRAATHVWITAERVVQELPRIDARPHGTFISRIFVEGVISAPGGADFTGIYPDYATDISAARTYQARALDLGWLRDYAREIITRTHKGVAS